MMVIDKLTLQLSGLSEEDGRALAQLLAQDLALTSLPHGGNLRVDDMKVEVAGAAGNSIQELSQRIVADLLRQFDRSL